MAEEVFELEGIYSIDSDQIESAIDDVNEKIEELMESMGSLGDVTDEIFVSAGDQAEAFNSILEDTNQIGADGIINSLEETGQAAEDAGSGFTDMSIAAEAALLEMESGAESAAQATEEIGTAAELAGETASDSFDQASESASSLFDSIGTGLAVIATAIASTKFVNAAEAQIAAEVKLEQAILRTDALLGSNLDTYKAWASEVQLATGIGDELTLFLTSNLAPLSDSEEGLKGITQATLDYAASLTKTGLIPTQRELIKAQEQIKAALDGEISTLERNGILFSELEKELLKTGTQSERLAIITNGLNANYGGLATSIFEASGELGQFKALGGFVGDLMETVGMVIMTAFAPVVAVLSDGVNAINGWLQNMLALEGPMGKIVVTLTALSIVLIPTLITTNLFSGAMQKLGFNSLFAALGLDGFKFSLDLATLGIAALVALVIVALFQSEQFRNLLDRLTQVVMLLVDSLLSALLPIFDLLIAILIPIIDLLVTLIDIALVPVIAIFDVLISVLGPLIEIFGVLIQVQLMPLMILLQLLTPLIMLLADALLFVADFVVNSIMIPAFNLLLGVINKIIDGINLLIKGANLIPGIEIELIEDIPDIEPIVVIREDNIDISAMKDLEVEAVILPVIPTDGITPTLEIQPPTDLEDFTEVELSRITAPTAATGEIFSKDKCECPPQTVDNSVNVNNTNELDTLTSIEKARTIQRQNALFSFNN